MQTIGVTVTVTVDRNGNYLIPLYTSTELIASIKEAVTALESGKCKAYVDPFGEV